MKVIQKYIIAGLLMFSLKIDSSAYGQSELVGAQLIRRLNIAVNLNDINEVERLLLLPGMSLEVLTSLNHLGYSVLHIAAEKNYPTIMKLLLEAGADPNIHIDNPNAVHRTYETRLVYPGATPLHLVALGLSKNAEANKECFDLLIKYGADPAATTLTRSTLLHVLAMYDNENWYYFMQIALNAGVDINAQVNFYDNAEFYIPSWTALHLAVKSNKPNRFEFVKELLKNGADTQIKDNEGETPLECISSTNPDKDMLELLFAEDKVNDDELRIIDSILSKNTKKNAEKAAVLESDVIRDKKHNKTLRFNDDAVVRYYNKNDDAWNDVLSLREA